MNVLYKVWGIITYVFTGFYAVGWLAVFYIIITFLNLSFAVIWGKAKLLGFMFFFLFCMGWGLATGVFLLLKQAGAAAYVTIPEAYIT